MSKFFDTLFFHSEAAPFPPHYCPGSGTPTNPTDPTDPTAPVSEVNMIGDVYASGPATSLVSSLATTGVVPGRYSSVQVNSKGLVTDGFPTAPQYSKEEIDAKIVLVFETVEQTLEDQSDEILSGLTAENVSTALGYYPYNASNPDNFTSNATNASLRDRNTHTGQQSASTIVETETRSFVTPEERTAIIHANRTALDNVSGTNTGDQTIVLEGDATGSGSSNFIVTLAGTGVAPGTYNTDTASVTPMQVDVKGRIVAFGEAAPMTPFFSNVQSKPTTLAGYGITDAVSSMSNVLPMLFANMASISVTTTDIGIPQIVDSLPTSLYRTLRYFVQATSEEGFQTTELIVIHDGVAASTTQYGSVTTSGSIITLNADVYGGNLRLLVTPLHTNTVFKIVRIAIDV